MRTFSRTIEHESNTPHASSVRLRRHHVDTMPIRREAMRTDSTIISATRRSMRRSRNYTKTAAGEPKMAVH